MKDFNILDAFKEDAVDYGDKKSFIKWMKKKTFDASIRVINLCDSLPAKNSTRVLTYQLVKSATSVGSNYRAACKGRSKAEFFSKICIVVEEADETIYWLESLQVLKLGDQIEVRSLLKEYEEVLAICGKAKDSTYNK